MSIPRLVARPRSLSVAGTLLTLDRPVSADRRWITRTERPSAESPSRTSPQRLPGLGGRAGALREHLEDAVLVLGLVFLVPVAILAMGMPVVLAARVVLAIAEWL